MLEITPFQAIRYNETLCECPLSSLLAPPYDVLDEADKRALLSKSGHNIVAIDLPHLPPKSAGPPEVYERSAEMLQDWLRGGILAREPSPALYVYHQRFEHEGSIHVRKMLIARVRLSPFSDGVILPHEHTFGGPKEDRLALMKATRCQLSSIFGLYADPSGGVLSLLQHVATQPSTAAGTLDGVENRLWTVTDPTWIESVRLVLRDKRVYIADGHHRYGTALLYRDWLRSRHNGSLPGNHPANFIMFVLACMDDPGCLILPYYRVLGEIDLDSVRSAWSAGTQESDRAHADLILHDGRSGKEVSLRYTDRAILAKLEPGQCAAWYHLDYAYLHRYLIDELLSKALTHKPDVHYVKSSAEVIRTAEQTRGVALLVKATPMDHLRAVSEAGGLMPQKSTYFHPKLATGLTLNPLE